MSIFKDILSSIQPEEVILAYSKLELKSDSDLLKKLIGILKGVIEKRRGMTRIEELASLTGEEEGNILLALRYLQEEGLIELDFIDRRDIFIRRGKRKGREGEGYKRRLKLGLQESRAFKRYLLRRDVAEIETLLKAD